MENLVRSDYEVHPPVWLTNVIILTAGLTLLTLVFLVWLLLRYRDSIYNWLYYVRWNTFSSVPPLQLNTEEDQELILGRTDYQPHLLSLSSLVSKAERSSSPPPYDDPPPYHIAVQIWGAPSLIISDPVLV